MLDRAKIHNLITQSDDKVYTNTQEIRAQIEELIAWIITHRKVMREKFPEYAPFEIHEISLQKNPYTIVGVDGSQIYTDHHERFNGYLIHIGSCKLDYGQEKSSVCFHTEPYLIMQRRTEREVNEMRSCAEYEFADRFLTEDPAQLVLFDGPIPLFDNAHIDSCDLGFCKKRIFFTPTTTRSMPFVAGYISMPPSYYWIEYLNKIAFLRNIPPIMRKIPDYEILPQIVFYVERMRPADMLQQEEREKVRVQQTHTYDFAARDEKCYWLMPDFSQNLASESNRNYYSLWFISSSMRYQEVARIEMAQEIFENKTTRERVLSQIADQVRKGMGYPVCLAEAHLCAVITEQDRQYLFHILRRQSNDIIHKTSFKLARKRRMIL